MGEDVLDLPREGDDYDDEPDGGLHRVHRPDPVHGAEPHRGARLPGVRVHRLRRDRPRTGPEDLVMADRTPGPLWTGETSALPKRPPGRSWLRLPTHPMPVDIEPGTRVAVYPADQPDDVRQAIYDDIHTELNIALGWNDSDPDEARDWRHDLVERIVVLALENGPPVYPAEGTPCPHIASSDEGTSYCTLAAEGTPDREQIAEAIGNASADLGTDTIGDAIAREWLLAAADAVMALVVPAGEVDARVARKIDLLRDERDEMRRSSEEAWSRVAALDREVDALRSVVRHALIHWSPKGPTPERVLLAEWDDTDWADSTWTPAEQKVLRDALDHIAAERDAINQATEDRP